MSSSSLRRLLISTALVPVNKRDNVGFAFNPIVTKRSPLKERVTVSPSSFNSPAMPLSCASLLLIEAPLPALP
jgi:hypothetical protein